MGELKANTPEQLYQAIGRFLQGDYTHEDLVAMYNDARKCASGFRVTYSALPKVPIFNEDPLDGLQDMWEWCDKSVKAVDDIVFKLERRTISEVVGQFKILRGLAKSIVSIVNSELKTKIQREAEAKLQAEYTKLRKKKLERQPKLSPLVLETAIVRDLVEVNVEVREEAVKIYLSECPEFKEELSKKYQKIDDAIKKINELVGSKTPTGKLLDIYCKLKDIPIEQQFDEVGYAYSLIDLADIIFDKCNRMYASIDIVIKTFKEIQEKEVQSHDESGPERTKQFSPIFHKNLPYGKNVKQRVTRLIEEVKCRNEIDEVYVIGGICFNFAFESLKITRELSKERDVNRLLDLRSGLRDNMSVIQECISRLKNMPTVLNSWPKTPNSHCFHCYESSTLHAIGCFCEEFHLHFFVWLLKVVDNLKDVSFPEIVPISKWDDTELNLESRRVLSNLKYEYEQVTEKAAVRKKVGETVKTTETERITAINIENFQGILGNVQAEDVQTGGHVNIHKNDRIEKISIARKFLKWIIRIVGGIVMAIITTVVIDTLGHFGWFEWVYNLVWSN